MVNCGANCMIKTSILNYANILMWKLLKRNLIEKNITPQRLWCTVFRKITHKTNQSSSFYFDLNVITFFPYISFNTLNKSSQILVGFDEKPAYVPQCVWVLIFIILIAKMSV